ncbi:hypothetical protein D1872_270660 [compost metagenome]
MIASAEDLQRNDSHSVIEGMIENILEQRLQGHSWNEGLLQPRLHILNVCEGFAITVVLNLEIMSDRGKLLF